MKAKNEKWCWVKFWSGWFLWSLHEEKCKTDNKQRRRNFVVQFVHEKAITVSQKNGHPKNDHEDDTILGHVSISMIVCHTAHPSENKSVYFNFTPSAPECDSPGKKSERAFQSFSTSRHPFSSAVQILFITRTIHHIANKCHVTCNISTQENFTHSPWETQ